MSCRTVRDPSEDERSELKRINRKEIGRVAMRAHMMLLSDRGLSAFDIADLHGCGASGRLQVDRPI